MVFQKITDAPVVFANVTEKEAEDAAVEEVKRYTPVSIE
jgi:hypothetical protein